MQAFIVPVTLTQTSQSGIMETDETEKAKRLKWKADTG